MSQERFSQGLLAPAEISLPNTPTPHHASIPASPGALELIESSQADRVEKATRFASPAPPSSSEMTPPPSAQPRAPSPSRQFPETAILPASPPATVKSTALAAFAQTKEPPRPEDVATATESDLRQLTNELGKTLQEARMSTAHFKLQYSLLAIESAEAVKRAEIEHEMTRREVEVFQTIQHRNRTSVPSHVSQDTPSPQVESLIKRYKELESMNMILNRRLGRAKKLIIQEQDKNDLLVEENTRLRKRIKENREHTTRLRSQGLLNLTPRHEFATPQRKPAPRFPDRPRGTGQNSFAALLAAGEALSGEAASLPSTPTVPRRPAKLHPSHSRGTHSLSSLPTTPSRPATADANLFTPVNKLNVDGRMSFSAPVSQVVPETDRRRHDRDSTISVSDEEAVTDDDVPASQASSLATSMLRRNPGSQEEPSIPTNPSKSSAALQSKLFGQVKKIGVHKLPTKRHASFGEADVPAKKARMSEIVGLGIGHWGSAGATSR
jgi:hypothetical protein